MAKALPPFPIHGKIANLTFTVRNDKQFVQASPGPRNLKRAGEAYFRNIDEFAGAAKVAQEIYRYIKPQAFDPREKSENLQKLGPVCRPYTQNYLTAQIKRKADKENKRRTKVGLWYAKEITFFDAVNALRGLDLSNESAPSGHLGMTPIGPQHNPTAIRLTGLQHAANAIGIHGNAQLEFRIFIHQSRVPELEYDRADRQWHKRQDPEGRSTSNRRSYHSQPTAWIPVDIVPKEGLHLPLPTGIWKEDDKYLTAVFCEWREIRTVGRRCKRLHDKGIARIAALHGPAADWTDNTRQLREPDPNHGRMSIPPSPKMDPRQNPEAYLAEALAMLHPARTPKSPPPTSPPTS